MAGRRVNSKRTKKTTSVQRQRPAVGEDNPDSDAVTLKARQFDVAEISVEPVDGNKALPVATDKTTRSLKKRTTKVRKKKRYDRDRRAAEEPDAMFLLEDECEWLAPPRVCLEVRKDGTLVIGAPDPDQDARMSDLLLVDRCGEA